MWKITRIVKIMRSAKMSRMIDDEEELKDYGLIENCSNLITEEKRCLDSWDDENIDYKRCKEINCYKKQLKLLEAENEKLKNRNIELEAYFKVNEDFQKAWQELNSIHNDLQKVYQEEHCDNLKYKQALENIRELGKKTGSMKLIEIVDEVLK
jgi:hypothetical protein